LAVALPDSNARKAVISRHGFPVDGDNNSSVVHATARNLKGAAQLECVSELRTQLNDCGTASTD